MGNTTSNYFQQSNLISDAKPPIFQVGETHNINPFGGFSSPLGHPEYIYILSWCVVSGALVSPAEPDCKAGTIHYLLRPLPLCACRGLSTDHLSLRPSSEYVHLSEGGAAVWHFKPASSEVPSLLMSVHLVLSKSYSPLPWGSSTDAVLFFSLNFCKGIGFINNNCKTHQSPSGFPCIVGPCGVACSESVIVNWNKEILILRNNSPWCSLCPKAFPQFCVWHTLLLLQDPVQM